MYKHSHSHRKCCTYTYFWQNILVPVGPVHKNKKTVFVIIEIKDYLDFKYIIVMMSYVTKYYTQHFNFVRQT